MTILQLFVWFSRWRRRPSWNMITDFRFGDIRTRHVMFSLCTKFHRNRVIIDRFTASSLLTACNWLISGQKFQFGGPNPQLRGVLDFFSTRTCFYWLKPNVLYKFHWNRSIMISAQIFRFSLYLWPPNFEVFGGVWAPLYRQVFLSNMISYLASNHVA